MYQDVAEQAVGVAYEPWFFGAGSKIEEVRNDKDAEVWGSIVRVAKRIRSVAGLSRHVAAPWGRSMLGCLALCGNSFNF